MFRKARSLAWILKRWLGPVTVLALAACGSSAHKAPAIDAGTMPDAGGPSLKLIAGVLGGCGNLDGIGSAARFSQLQGMASDGANVFLVDGSAIRQVVLATGAVSTLAGATDEDGEADGPGADARFWSLRAIASDSAGNLFVTDGPAIRRIALDSRTVSRLAGDASQRGTLDGTGNAARFSFPVGVASDGAGHLFVADDSVTDGPFIRKIDVATSAVSTLGGPGHDAITGIAFDRSTGGLLVSAGQTVGSVGMKDGVVSTIAGVSGQSGDDDGLGDVARFQNLAGIALDGRGHLFVTDQSSNTIRQVDLASGLVTTVAGAPASTAHYLDGPAANARFLWPMGIVADGGGNLFVADSGNCRIRKIDLGTGTVTSLVGPTTTFGDSAGVGSDTFFRLDVNAMVSDGKGVLFMADDVGNVIWRIEAATGAFSALAGSPGNAGNQDGPGAAARFSHPTGITMDGTGSLFVADGVNRAIRKIDPATGTVATVAVGHLGGTRTDDLLAFPGSVTSDGAGNLFVTDSVDGTVCRVVVASGEISIWAGSPSKLGHQDGIGTGALLAPSGIASDGAGTLFVIEPQAVRRIEISTRAVTTIAGSAEDGPSLDGTGASARFQYLQSVTYDGAGNLYVADGQTSHARSATLRKIAIATGLVTTVAGAAGRVGVSLGPLPATLSNPRGLAYVPKAGLFFVDEGAILLADL